MMDYTTPQRGKSLLELTVVGSLFPDHPSGDIICFSKNDSLATVFKGLAEHKILSAPIYDPVHRAHNAFIDMVDIVSFLVNEYSEQELADLHSLSSFINAKAGSVADQTVETLKMFFSPVITIPIESRGIEAFKTMHENRVSAVAVVDANGKLVGNISVSDLKIIGFDGSMLARLYYPISQFLKLLAKDKGSSMVEAPICVSLQSQFREVMGKLVQSRIHRVYITDDSGVPTGVITQHEVLHALLNYLHVVH